MSAAACRRHALAAAGEIPVPPPSSPSRRRSPRPVPWPPPDSPHFRDKGRQLRRLRRHRSVHIAHLPARLRQHRRHLPQQRRAVRPGVARIAVWKQLADVPSAAAPSRASITAWVSTSASECPSSPVQRAPSPRPVPGRARYQPVYVIAVSNAQIRHALFSLSRRNASARVRSEAVVILMFSRQPGAR